MNSYKSPVNHLTYNVRNQVSGDCQRATICQEAFGCHTWNGVIQNTVIGIFHVPTFIIQLELKKTMK